MDSTCSDRLNKYRPEFWCSGNSDYKRMIKTKAMMKRHLELIL